MARLVVLIYTVPICNNKYISESELQYTLDSLGRGSIQQPVLNI